MSRFPGLQFPTSNSGQPQTRQQQRPGVNLLQRLFEMKGAKLAKQGQDFQEDSFNSAKEAYEGALKTYETNKAAHDASEQAKYDAAQARYNGELGTYNSAKSQYDQQLAAYNDRANTYKSQADAVSTFASMPSDITYRNGVSGYYTGSYPYTPQFHRTPQYDSFFDSSGNSVAPKITAAAPGESPSFSAAPPKFNYTTTAFGSAVPSFEYVAAESPGSANVKKLATMSGISNQLQEVLPENARNRNRAPTSFYNIF